MTKQGAQNGHVSYVFSKYKCKQTMSVLVQWDLYSEDTLGTEASVSWIGVPWIEIELRLLNN